jgi:hypothetical protein
MPSARTAVEFRNWLEDSLAIRGQSEKQGLPSISEAKDKGNSFGLERQRLTIFEIAYSIIVKASAG